jgi:phenylpropionate dioxygenase-like ring-hydroxylating dioxygenase large terminal subunit
MTDTRNTDIGLDERIIERVLAHLANRTTDTVERDLFVPIRHFVDKDRAQDELRLIKTLPLIVGHCSEIKAAGDFITRDILGMGLLLVRRADDSIAAYLNMCRHRGGKVESKSAGRKRHFTCQYHGWSYEGASGALSHVPHADYFDPIDATCTKLVAFKAEERHGLIFVDFSSDPARSVAEYLGPEVDAIIEPWDLRRSVIYLDKSFPLDANWKLVMDGAIDSLHPEFLHANSVAKFVASRVAVFQDLGRHGRLYQPRRKLEEMVQAGEVGGNSSKYIATDMLIYPNSLMIGAPDHVEFWTVWPSVSDPSKSVINIRFLVREDILTPKMEERIRKSWDILENAALTEDWPMEVAMQRNIMAHPAGEFRYGRGEVSAQHLHRQLSKDLGEA